MSGRRTISKPEAVGFLVGKKGWSSEEDIKKHIEFLSNYSSDFVQGLVNSYLENGDNWITIEEDPSRHTEMFFEKLLSKFSSSSRDDSETGSSEKKNGE